MTVVSEGIRPLLSTDYEKSKRKIEFKEHNHVEGKLGLEKQGYDLNEIKAKFGNTSNSYIGAILYVTNFFKLAKLNNLQF